MWYLCYPLSGPDRHCHFIPVVIRRWREQFKPSPSRVFRFVWLIRATLIDLLDGPRPRPWRPTGVIAAGVDDATLTQLQVIAAISAAAESLHLAHRSTIDDALLRVVEELKLPAGVSVERRTTG